MDWAMCVRGWIAGLQRAESQFHCPVRCGTNRNIKVGIQHHSISQPQSVWGIKRTMEVYKISEPSACIEQHMRSTPKQEKMKKKKREREGGGRRLILMQGHALEGRVQVCLRCFNVRSYLSIWQAGSFYGGTCRSVAVSLSLLNRQIRSVDSCTWLDRIYWL